jgi:hypothetical protein
MLLQLLCCHDWYDRESYAVRLPLRLRMRPAHPVRRFFDNHRPVQSQLHRVEPVPEPGRHAGNDDPHSDPTEPREEVQPGGDEGDPEADDAEGFPRVELAGDSWGPVGMGGVGVLLGGVDKKSGQDRTGQDRTGRGYCRTDKENTAAAQPDSTRLHTQ